MIVTRRALSRRTLLRGLGVSMALPFLDAMIPAFAGGRALAATSALRFGAVYVPNGMWMDAWTPATEGVGFALSPTLEALAPFRDAVTVVSGLSVAKNAGASLHSRASTRWLTGVPPREGQSQAAVQAGASMDQIAAQLVGDRTQFASLEFALEPNDFAGSCDPGFSCAYVTTISWRDATTPLPMEHNPRAVFERLFGDQGTTDPAARRIRMQRDRSILDSVVEEAAGLARRVGVGDRLKLNQYLDAVRDIERRLQRTETHSHRELPVVAQPGAIPESYEAYAKLMFDLQVVAYQADVTRIQTFMLGRELSARQYPEIGVPEAHHPTSHHTSDPVKISRYAKINAFHTRLFAYYVDKLRATPDGEGTLLDQMMLLYGSGMSDGNAHATTNLPVALVGGGLGRAGRHLRYADETPLPNLHLTLLDRLGVRTERLGDSTGPLEGLALV